MAKYMDSENFKHFWNNILKPNLLKKVDKVSGKGLSTNDFTDTYKNAIGSLQDSVGALNTTKVDKVIGKDLSTNDFTNEYKDLIVANKDAISKIKGFIYPCTAQALEDMTQEQQAELYVQGYRAIKTENNGTVVLLGLASDGSLEWLGCNEDTTNRFDNPDFAIAQAGYGGMHGNTTYAADRWVSSNLSNASFDGEKLVVVEDGSSLGAVYQKLIFNSPCKITITAGVAVQNAWEIAMFDAESAAKIASSAGSQAQEALLNAEITSDLTGKEISIFFYLFPGSAGGGSAKIFNAALYKGSYTPKTLPPYVPKGYAAELAECLRYYQAVSSDSWTTCARPYGSAEFLVNLSAASPMRTVPQIAGKFRLFLANGWNEELAPISIALTVCGYTAKIATQVDAENGKACIVTGTYELIADL